MSRIVAIIVLFIEMIKNTLGWTTKCKSDVRLDGKVVVITGANTGIGKETAYQLSRRGAKIIIGCRDLRKAETAINDIKSKNPTANITALKLDLSSLRSVRQFVKSVEQQESRIDILINNAGVMSCPESQTEDGFEMQFGTNHLGHFLLTLSLIPLMRKSSKARIITVSSAAHMLGEINFENINLRNGAYHPQQAYQNSKLANLLFSRELARRLGKDSNIKAYCLHPGIIKTDLFRHKGFSGLVQSMINMVALNTELGAQTSLYCSLEESIENESGLYYADCHRVHRLLAKARDDETARTLWQMSCDLVKLENHLKI